MEIYKSSGLHYLLPVLTVYGDDVQENKCEMLTGICLRYNNYSMTNDRETRTCEKEVDKDKMLKEKWLVVLSNVKCWGLGAAYKQFWKCRYHSLSIRNVVLCFDILINLCTCMNVGILYSVFKIL